MSSKKGLCAGNFFWIRVSLYISLVLKFLVRFGCIILVGIDSGYLVGCYVYSKGIDYLYWFPNLGSCFAPRRPLL
ncbi:hypothetical protein M6B38_311480 [Iris pallida]|uniref:Uncharacterized protein n=1 Tax=Iris pallida TaxID=29817 RepID=A0AAX6HI84_IRIPA|nr:hypothetical protein M6B38_311480 [Iris pallida]